jgi:biopolymer transport protein ExbB
MALISWTVMVGKGLYVRKVVRANDRFLDIFDRIGADAIRLDTHFASIDTIYVERSTLYRVCRAGTNEWKRRLAEDPVGGISAEAIESIRATLDREAVYENQRLNSSMVLLTIAISGGPFLGLLGTVVGVMITFAAIASTGDVNINAIAPGIAAALVATVAGLGVAIPALFGYNYLITRIKDVTAETQVFIDEFVTKLAEPRRPRPGAEQFAAE